MPCISQEEAKKFAIEITEVALKKSLFRDSIDIYKSTDADKIGDFIEKMSKNLYDNSISYETIKLFKAILESNCDPHKNHIDFYDRYSSDLYKFINTLNKFI